MEEDFCKDERFTIILPEVEKPIIIKYENENRKFEYDEETMTLTIIDRYYVHKDNVPQIIENINKLEDWEDE